MAAKKAVFLCVQKIHSNKKNQDYRKIDLFVPFYKDGNGFERGGVTTFFTPTDSKLGEGIAMGTIVVPDFDFDPYSNRADLKSLEVVEQSPFVPEDFS